MPENKDQPPVSLETPAGKADANLFAPIRTHSDLIDAHTSSLNKMKTIESSPAIIRQEKDAQKKVIKDSFDAAVELYIQSWNENIKNEKKLAIIYTGSANTLTEKLDPALFEGISDTLRVSIDLSEKSTPKSLKSLKNFIDNQLTNKDIVLITHIDPENPYAFIEDMSALALSNKPRHTKFTAIGIFNKNSNNRVFSFTDNEIFNAIAEEMSTEKEKEKNVYLRFKNLLLEKLSKDKLNEDIINSTIKNSKLHYENNVEKPFCKVYTRLADLTLADVSSSKKNIVNDKDINVAEDINETLTPTPIVISLISDRTNLTVATNIPSSNTQIATTLAEHTHYDQFQLGDKNETVFKKIFQSVSSIDVKKETGDFLFKKSSLSEINKGAFLFNACRHLDKPTEAFAWVEKDKSKDKLQSTLYYSKPENSHEEAKNLLYAVHMQVTSGLAALTDITKLKGKRVTLTLPSDVDEAFQHAYKGYCLVKGYHLKNTDGELIINKDTNNKELEGWVKEFDAKVDKKADKPLVAAPPTVTSAHPNNEDKNSSKPKSAL